MAAPTTPLARPIISGTTGQDVLAVKRALSRAGYIDWTQFTNVAGPFFMDAIHKFQHDHKIKPAGYGPHTHSVLLSTHKKGSKDWAWDSYSIGLEHAEYVLLHTTPEQRIRSAILQAAQNIYAHRESVAYSNRRPFPLYSMGGPIPAFIDCSGYAIDCYHAAGARCPVSGGSYDGEGYTGSLLSAGKKVASAHYLKPGDLIFYGYTTRPSLAFPYGSPTHVAVYDGNGGVYSNGHHPMGHYPDYYGLAINCYVTYNVVP